MGKFIGIESKWDRHRDRKLNRDPDLTFRLSPDQGRGAVSGCRWTQRHHSQETGRKRMQRPHQNLNCKRDDSCFIRYASNVCSQLRPRIYIIEPNFYINSKSKFTHRNLNYPQTIPGQKLTSIDEEEEKSILRPCRCSRGHQLYDRVVYKKVKNNVCQATQVETQDTIQPNREWAPVARWSSASPSDGRCRLVTDASQLRGIDKRRRRCGRGALNLRSTSFVGDSERQSFVRCSVVTLSQLKNKLF
ncbi:hypothetical protein EVAR_54709_1 [Eumeta japonica]|uniref:Uncharacterized protein n=1 Tax=Eumeta variegata TaxID=151549 RepID=A0A4C1YSD1_EUMVA|nr:hypothetical protein EVAR_54709_1 [Eumeta japonica]